MAKEVLIPETLREKIIKALEENSENQKLIEELKSKTDTKIEWGKTGFDILKNFISWLIIFLIGIAFLDKCNRNKQMQMFFDQRKTDLRINALNSFERSSVDYLYTASDIYHRKNLASAVLLSFEGEKVDAMSLSIDNLKRVFDSNQLLDSLTFFKKLVDSEFHNYVKPIIDSVFNSKIQEQVVNKNEFVYNNSDSLYHILSRELRVRRKQILDKIYDSMFSL